MKVIITMTHIDLTAQERDTTQNPRQLRTNGWTPATLYAKGVPSKSIQVPSKDFYLAFKNGNKQFNLVGLNVKAKVAQLQVHSTKLNVLNVEFQIEN
jgi:ribosomal protein L25 (general stress protein Ctc)